MQPSSINQAKCGGFFEKSGSEQSHLDQDSDSDWHLSPDRPAQAVLFFRDTIAVFLETFVVSPEMEEIAQAIIQHSTDNTEDLAKLRKLLVDRHDMICARRDEIDAILSVHITPEHTLGYVALLSGKGEHPDQIINHQLYCAQVSRVVEHANVKQLHYCALWFVQICRIYADICLNSNSSMSSIRVLKKSIDLFRPTKNHLTPLHQLYIRACIHSKCYHCADVVLNEDILEVEHKKTGTTPTDFLLYHYYGGVVRAAQKKWTKAMYLFKMTFTAPAEALSSIALESYKKYLLCNLIENGKGGEVPKYTSSAVSRSLHQHTHPYQELVKACQHNSNKDGKAENILEHIQLVVQKYYEQFTKDGNIGLVKQVIQAQVQQSVLRCTQTYITLPLAHIAQQSNLQDVKNAELLVLRMIEEHKIFAEINHDGDMVAFKDDPEEYQSPEVMEMINNRVLKAIEINNRLRKLSEELMLTPDYITKSLLKEEQRADVSEFIPGLDTR